VVAQQNNQSDNMFDNWGLLGHTDIWRKDGIQERAGCTKRSILVLCPQIPSMDSASDAVLLEAFSHGVARKSISRLS